MSRKCEQKNYEPQIMLQVNNGSSAGRPSMVGCNAFDVLHYGLYVINVFNIYLVLILRGIVDQALMLVSSVKQSESVIRYCPLF